MHLSALGASHAWAIPYPSPHVLRFKDEHQSCHVSAMNWKSAERSWAVREEQTVFSSKISSRAAG